MSASGGTRPIVAGTGRTGAASTDAASVLERAVALVQGRERVLLGIAGAPGAGKTTAAQWLVRALNERGIAATHVPMDGFHLADVALDALGRRDRKGAIDTFDGHGYLALLQRLRSDTAATVYAPEFERDIEQPIAGAIAVEPAARVIVSEGNYLLASETPWPSVRTAFDEVWFADVDDAPRIDRLTARHVRFGKSPDEAAAWVASVDEPNARAILAGRDSADLVVDVDALEAWHEA
ncbi:nucleoside/nucleotide kinase family protein [Herbiconiux sp. L3-i23]|uniref:nucleoside/nucleotide kinase family protein n=1 Tax=Herbiconiux sp. L3-i23 TaxID=2905871 RepID=UPI002052250E|nr:nucleoside/nucleotide kinase family protein [Herbiconiux sp. L3-i23]BDI21716.1 nucleoside/nucleotide kinase family protein [Herbiconiux sp. L3-i23]